MKKPTKRQSEIFEFIKSHIEEYMFPPTYAEINNRFGYASNNAAVCHIKAMEQKGMLRTYPGKFGMILNNVKVTIEDL